jgi:hypothetical protein
MIWDPTGNTIFYTSELSLNTEYSISTNNIILNSSFFANTVSSKISIALFNSSAAINSINSEMYVSNVSTNAVNFNALFTYKPFTASAEEVEVVAVDAQIWIG